MISAKIIADSVNPVGARITSWLLRYPRFIHAEFMTHRVFSRNAASSRAIPLAKMLAAIKEEPALPEFWASEHKGMQAIEELPDELAQRIRQSWLSCAYYMSGKAENLSQRGLAKSLCNRLIEPWSHITVLATATDHRNFFALRAHPAAMPEFQVLAYRMLREYLDSAPLALPWGAWHLPFGEHFNHDDTGEERLKIATARAARLSYLTFDSEAIDKGKDIELHDRLLSSGHMSPFEHCAQAIDPIHPYSVSNFDSDLLSGWKQYRKNFPQEKRTEVDLAAVMATKPGWIELPQDHE